MDYHELYMRAAYIFNERCRIDSSGDGQIDFEEFVEVRDRILTAQISPDLSFLLLWLYCRLCLEK